MKDIKSLYIAAKNGSQAAINSYIEAVNNLILSPNDYLANSEYIINSEPGLSTLHEFVDRYGLSISVFDNIMEKVDQCISKCESLKKDSSNYQKTKKYLESYKNKYKNCFEMYEYFADSLPSNYSNTYYSFNENGVQNNHLIGMISKFGEAAIPDMIITASKLGSIVTDRLFNYLENNQTYNSPTLYQWISECASDSGISEYSESISLKNIQSKNLTSIIDNMRARNNQLFREAMIVGNEDALYDYTEAEVEAIDDLISFKEYQMTYCESPEEAMKIQKEIYSLYEEFDGMRFNEFYKPENEISDEINHSLICESLSEFFTENSNNKFKFAYKAAYDYDTGHSLKITYSLDRVIVTNVGVAKPLHDELLDTVNSVKEIMNDDSSFKIPRALVTSLSRLFHMKGNIEIRKNSIVQFLQEYIDEIGYVDFQAKNVKIVSIYDRADHVELEGPINIVGIYAANDINKNKSLALNEYELKQMQDKVRSKNSNFKINTISVGDIQTTPTFMTTYWDPNSDKNLVNGNGDVISNDGMDRDNTTNIISAKEIHGYGSKITDKKYSDALGDFVDPIHDISHAKRYRMYKSFNNERAQRSLDKESKLIRNMQDLYKSLSEKYDNPDIDQATKIDIREAMDELGNDIKSEKSLYNAAKRLFDKADYEGVYNTLKNTYNEEKIIKFKEMIENLSSKFNISNKYIEDVATSVIPMQPGPTTHIEEDTWGGNTHDKKTGGIPKYISNNHDMARYGEDDTDADKSDDKHKKTLEDYRRPSSKPKSDTDDKDDILRPVDDVKSTDSDNDISDRSHNLSGMNNYYYYTYNNSLNKDQSTHSSTDNHSITIDDHSTNKHIKSHNAQLDNDDDENTNITKESAKPWELDIFQNKLITEKVGDADDDKPKSDHPVKDTLMDIDRATTKYQQKAKKIVQDVQNVGRAFVKPINRTEQWINNLISTWKDADETRIKEKLADPHARNNLFSAVKKAITAGSLLKAGILLNPIFLFISVTKGIGNHKKEGRIRNEMIAELKTEIQICGEKIRDAERDNDNKAKYQLMRFKNELNKKLARAAGMKNW